LLREEEFRNSLNPQPLVGHIPPCELPHAGDEQSFRAIFLYLRFHLPNGFMRFRQFTLSRLASRPSKGDNIFSFFSAGGQRSRSTVSHVRGNKTFLYSSLLAPTSTLIDPTADRPDAQWPPRDGIPRLLTTSHYGSMLGQLRLFPSPPLPPSSTSSQGILFTDIFRRAPPLK